MSDDVTYHGTHTGTAGPGTVEVIENGQVTGLLAHIVCHSPTGFSWGYAGSGPADLARSLLIAALGDRAWCTTCAGIRQVVYDGPSDMHGRPFDRIRDAGLPVDPDGGETWPARTRCCDCDDGYRLDLPYMDFKFKVVAGWGGDWQVTRQEVLAWLVEHHPGFFQPATTTTETEGDEPTP